MKVEVGMRRRIHLGKCIPGYAVFILAKSRKDLPSIANGNLYY